MRTLQRIRLKLITAGIVVLLLYGISMGTVLNYPKLSAVNGGYEGGKLWLEGFKTANPYGSGGGKLPNEIVWHLGQPVPSYAATWLTDKGSFNIDPYDETDYWQNLIVTTDGSAFFERNWLGEFRSDSVEFTEIVSQTDEEITRRTIEASVYYATVDLTLQTDVDEGWLRSEKDDPWRATQLILNAQAYEYSSLPGADGNESNWSSLLGVEVVSTEKIMGKGDVVMFNFHSGQMLPMYDSWSDFMIDDASSVSSGTGSADFISSITYRELSNKLVPVVKNVYVPLSWSAFGTEPAGGAWLEPQVHVTLRLHILKVGSWLVTQKVGEPYVPPTHDRDKGIDYLGNFVSWITNPFNLGLVGMFLLILVVGVAVIVTAPVVNRIVSYLPKKKL